MKITRVEVKNYKGIKSAAFAVGTGGAIIKGKCCSGKTSLRDAVLAALSARDIGPEHIHHGAERSEILVDTDASVRVRRTASAAGAGLTVTNADGDKWSRPQTRLDDLFGPSLDPAAFYLADKRERQRMLLAAMPATVTAEDVAGWTGGRYQGPVDGHGLEVVGRVRKQFYDERTEANRTAKAAAEGAEAKKMAADELAAKAPKVAIEVEVAKYGLDAAMSAISALELRQTQATEQEARAAGTREKIALLRGEAEEIEVRGPVVPPPSELAKIEDAMDLHRAKIDELKAALAAEGRALAEMQTKLDGYHASMKAGGEATTATASKIRQADDLEASLASVVIAAPTPEEIAQAADTACKARDALADAESVEAAALALADYEVAKVQSDADAAAASELDVIVETLTTTALKELATRSKLIPGLAFADAGITLDGKVLDDLSGSEQLAFSVDLAKRLSPNGRLLCVDKLEAFDPDALAEFVALCTSGGWQLLGTRVERGELVIEAIEADVVGDVVVSIPDASKSQRLTIVMPEGDGTP
jgi:hypothetical protein